MPGLLYLDVMLNRNLGIHGSVLLAVRQMKTLINLTRAWLENCCSFFHGSLRFDFFVRCLPLCALVTPGASNAGQAEGRPCLPARAAFIFGDCFCFVQFF